MLLFFLGFDAGWGIILFFLLGFDYVTVFNVDKVVSHCADILSYCNSMATEYTCRTEFYQVNCPLTCSICSPSLTVGNIIHMETSYCFEEKKNVYKVFEEKKKIASGGKIMITSGKIRYFRKFLCMFIF